MNNINDLFPPDCSDFIKDVCNTLSKSELKTLVAFFHTYHMLPDRDKAILLCHHFPEIANKISQIIGNIAIEGED